MSALTDSVFEVSLRDGSPSRAGGTTNTAEVVAESVEAPLEIAKNTGEAGPLGPERDTTNAVTAIEGPVGEGSFW